ncbi:hydrocephalus-inducing protein homolog [Lycorma delicatula]|uniref:hydrocephalus-inducing protein homolog n=1 Tax=Lycorma delicatula TaxID=130591 RepID=UPI003F51393C
MINFGVVLVGQTVKRSVAIVNKTPASAEIFLTATSPNENKYVTIEPSVPKLIKPHGSVKFYFNFSPRTLIKTSFTIQVFLHCLNIVEPLCILKGYCIGPEFSLDRDYIPFGCVVLGCSSSVKFLLLNTGDIGSKFSWSCSKEEYTSWIVIEPSFGYISPGSEITLNVRFTPDSPISYFRTEVICNLESFKKLKLVITGSCVSVDPPSTPINFSCPVRKSDFQKVTLHNPNGDMWTVCPVFKGKEFKGSQTVIINALNDAQYEIEYSPLTMTSETEKHMGTVFFPFPDGSCKLFSLKGDALPPQVEDVVLWTIPAKVNVNKTLSLTNWLQIPQRFVMSSEVIEKGNPDPIFTLSGSKYIDVGASQNRIYNLSLHCYRESKVKLKIYFTNESLQQYMWFDIRVNVVPPLDLATYTLKTRVRLTTYQTIPLINPLSKPLKFHLSSSELSITAQESPVTIEGLQKGEIVILYTPLFPETGREILISVLSEALGPFPYKLLLNAGNPVPEDTIVISAEIGRNVTVPLDVINMSTVKTEFVCMPDHSDLSIASSVSADPGKHAILNIVYEPSSIGTITRLLTVNSTDAGAFYFPIVATGCLPKPSGPHILKPGETIEFKIKNVFNTQKQYSSLVDSPAFIVKNPTLEIQPKKEEKIRVQMLPKNELGNFTFPEFPITGKLSVVLLSESSTTSDSVDLLNNQISWPFYLKGIIN